MNLPPLEAVEREIGLRGRFYDFIRLAWSHVDAHPFTDGWHIELVADVLERAHRRELRKAVIEEPPGMSKSSIVCALWPVWSWIRDPSRGVLGTSFDAKLTRRDAGKSLTLIQGEWFRRRWGDIVAVGEGAAAGDYTNTAGGWRFSTSTGGKATGRHPDVRIIDDPTKPQTVSPGTLADAERYWRETLSTRQRDAQTVVTVLIMQRLAVGDLAGIFEREGGWHIVRLPMRYELQDAYPGDPRRTPGELLCPARFGEEAVKELERNLGTRGAAAQLQQRPFPEGGAVFKREWLRWYDPDTGIIAPRDGEPVRRVPPFAQQLQTWDLTFKNETDSHFVAGQVWGIAGADFFGIDGLLERLDFVGSLKAVLELRAKHPRATGILIEDKANGPAVMSVLRKSVPGVIPVEPKGGKDARANAASPVVEAGNVYLPLRRTWAEKLAESLAAFPVGEWDDDVDAFTQLVAHAQRKSIDYAAAMKALGGRNLFIG